MSKNMETSRARGTLAAITMSRAPAHDLASRPSAPDESKPRPGTGAFVLFSLLLVAPVFALSRLAMKIEWEWVAAAPAVLSALTFLVYRIDKHRAEADGWRVPESTLHGLELLGGWPGAFLAQRILRHKVSKVSYQITFWLIVAAHQYAAIDSTLDWRCTRLALSLVKARLG